VAARVRESEGLPFYLETACRDESTTTYASPPMPPTATQQRARAKKEVCYTRRRSDAAEHGSLSEIILPCRRGEGGEPCV